MQLFCVSCIFHNDDTKLINIDNLDNFVQVFLSYQNSSLDYIIRLLNVRKLKGREHCYPLTDVTFYQNKVTQIF